MQVARRDLGQPVGLRPRAQGRRHVVVDGLLGAARPHEDVTRVVADEAAPLVGFLEPRPLVERGLDRVEALFGLVRHHDEKSRAGHVPSFALERLETRIPPGGGDQTGPAREH